MNKITMYPPSDKGLPIRTMTSDTDELTLVGVAHSTYSVVLEVDGVIRDMFSMIIGADTIRNISLLEQRHDVTFRFSGSFDELKQRYNVTYRFSGSFGGVEGPSVFDNARVVNLSDYGANGNGTFDNFNALKQVLDASVNEPLVLEVDPGSYYLKGGVNQRLEVWPNKSQGLKIVGLGDVEFLPENNRTTNRHEFYFMQLQMDRNGLGFEASGFKVNGIRNPQEELFFTVSDTNPMSNVPLCRGITVNGAKVINMRDVVYTNMYGGYCIVAEDYDLVNIVDTNFTNIGGNDSTESFGMAIYLGGQRGDAVVNIDNCHATGMQGSKPDYISWIGVVLENGTIQSRNEDLWLIDKNTTVNITNSSFIDFQSTFHVESLAGNVYWNVDNVAARSSNYQITAGILGEYKEMSNRVTMDMLSFGRLWGIVHGLYYSEKEAADNISGHNRIDMYNSVINYTHHAGYPIIPQGVAYGDSVKPYLHNCQLNNLPKMLVQNGSAILYDCEINLSSDSTQTRASLQSGWFSDPAVQKVEYNNTYVNPSGQHKNVIFGSTPVPVKNNGFVPPPFTEPLLPPI